MQYFRPAHPHFVGDCMPFFHDGVYHLFYLLDEDHHGGNGGLGGHQWAHASSRDLVSWQHHPAAIVCEREWEKSICTGSVFHHDGTFYAYYATRMADWCERLSLATSSDGETFIKTLPNPFAGPGPGYAAKDYRDPFVFHDAQTGLFHMLVTARLADFPLARRGGCLAHLVSDDLSNWTLQPEPFFVPGGDPGYPSIPECPDYFRWGEWYYLIFGLGAETRYRMSRSPFGPWQRPSVDTFDGPTLASVMKTAAFGSDRRIGVAFLAGRRDGKDDGERLYAGNAVFRELVQHPDGQLGTKFPPEMRPSTATPIKIEPAAVTEGVRVGGNSASIAIPRGIEAARLGGVPQNFVLSLSIVPKPGAGEFGLCLRADSGMDTGYYLRFSPGENRVTLNRQTINVSGLDQPFDLELVVKDDIVDVCIDHRRCLIDRCGQLRGDSLFIFTQDASVEISEICLRPIAAAQ